MELLDWISNNSRTKAFLFFVFYMSKGVKWEVKTENIFLFELDFLFTIIGAIVVFFFICVCGCFYCKHRNRRGYAVVSTSPPLQVFLLSPSLPFSAWPSPPPILLCPLPQISNTNVVTATPCTSASASPRATKQQATLLPPSPSSELPARPTSSPHTLAN